MLSNEYMKTNFLLGSYDCLGEGEENIYTNQFTNDLSELIFLTDDHPFSYFFRGFIHLQLLEFQNIIRHGYYHRETKSVNFFVKYPQKYGSWIYFAWKNFCQNDDVKVYIYGSYCSDLYLSDEYEIDKNLFYKEYIKVLLNEL